MAMADPYARKLVNRSFYHAKTDIRLRVVVVLQGLLENRGLELIQPISRAFPKGTVIELIGTDEQEAAPGGHVGKIAYVAFAELLDGGVLLTGDEIRFGKSVIGVIAGYDDTHMPNHQNTVMTMPVRMSGKDLGLKPGSELFIKGF